MFLFVLPFAHTVALRHLSLFITALFALYLWLRDPPQPMPCRLPLIIWAAICWASLLWSVDPAYTFGELKNEVGYTMVTLLAFYCLTRSNENLRYWLYAVLSALCVLSIIAIVNYVRRGAWDLSGEVNGLLGDRNSYSTFIVLITPLALFTALHPAAKGRLRNLAWASLALGLVSGSFTLNRMMWPALMVMAVLFFALYLRRSRTDNSTRLPGLAAGLLLLAVFVGQFAMVSITKGGAQQSGFAGVQQSFSQDPRFLIWNYAKERIAERPIVGHGYGRGILKDEFQQHFGNPLYWHGHNLLLNYLLELGLLGTIALLALAACLIRELWRLYAAGEGQTRELGILGLAIFAGILVKTLTDDIIVRDNALLFWAMMGMILGAARGQALPVATAALS
jgi:O-antigen ligase